MYAVGVGMLPWEVEKARRFIEEIEVGGVFIQPVTGIAFDPERTADNTNALQAMAMAKEIPVPVFIAADQEGGIPQALSRLTGGTDQPGNMGLGATFDPAATHVSYGIMGEELSALGINVAFSPVLGLMPSLEESSMYTRCFGEISAEVTAHARQAVRGLQENLVIAASKHFPSHSTAPGDEHFILPVNEDDEQTVRDQYLPPFIAAVEAGDDMMMTTHAVYSAWEAFLPTSFSRRILTDLLRGELGFDGLIICDAIGMGSIMLTEWDEHPDVLAISAGVDIVLDLAGDAEPLFGVAPGNLEYAWDVVGQIEAVAEAVTTGGIPAEQIDASVRRILRTKMKYCLFADPFSDVAAVGDHLSTPEHVETSQGLHADALTLVRNDDGLWPINDADGTKVHVVCPRAFLSQMYPDAAWQTIATSDLLKEVRKLAPSTRGDKFDVDPKRRAINRIVRRAKRASADVLVIGTYNAYYYASQRSLVDKLLDLDIPTILVAVGMPYDLLAFPEASTYLCSYSNRDLALETVARGLFGLVEAGGRLPVSLPGLYEVGWSAGR
ncbi:glycoside hydrolase family 3 protein, partial [Thermodesulfobacteriota bacterium]